MLAGFIPAAMVFVLAMGGLGQAAEPNGIQRLEELILPRLQVREGATFREGLEVVRQAWDRKFPGESFPVVVLDREDGRDESSPLVKIDLSNIPASEAIKYLASWGSVKSKQRLDILILRTYLLNDEGWYEPFSFVLSDKTMAAFGLVTSKVNDPDANREFQKRLEGYGLTFAPAYGVRWFGDRKQLLVLNTEEQNAKARALFMLLEAGYSIEK